MRTILLTIFYIILVLYLYNIILTFFAWNIKDEEIFYDPNDYVNFGIIIPCHNEEDVIYDTLLAISNSDYNKNNYTVYVILDNCTDNTEFECNRFIEDSDIKVKLISVKGGSKPKAINLAVKYLKENNIWDTLDSLLMVDSDNKISNTLMSTYNYYHSTGEKVLQCRILSDNDDTTVAKGFTSSFNSMAIGYQYARNRVGLSATLSGTGFSVSRDVWDVVGFDRCTTLTEDLEFSMLCVLKGITIKYIHKEYVLNQNLDELKPSINQRVRWCRGHMQTSAKLSKLMFLEFIKHPSLQLIDSLIILNVPSKSLLYAIFNLTSVIMYGLELDVLPTYLLIILVLYNILFSAYCNDFKTEYIIPYFIYSTCMMYILIYGTITYKQTTWVKTKHKKIEHK